MLYLQVFADAYYLTWAKVAAFDSHDLLWLKGAFRFLMGLRFKDWPGAFKSNRLKLRTIRIFYIFLHLKNVKAYNEAANHKYSLARFLIFLLAYWRRRSKK
jgi:hypothetical protein